jgi:hypothetical protein
MVITKGRYRGWDIGMGLVGGTDGQVEVQCSLANQFYYDKFKSTTDEQIKEVFGIGSRDTTFYRMTDGETPVFGWSFMFSGLQGDPTQYEFLAWMFRGIDKIMDIMNKTN